MQKLGAFSLVLGKNKLTSELSLKNYTGICLSPRG